MRSHCPPQSRTSKVRSERRQRAIPTSRDVEWSLILHSTDARLVFGVRPEGPERGTAADIAGHPNVV